MQHFFIERERSERLANNVLHQQNTLSSSVLHIKDKNLIHQIQRVLRMKEGDEFIALDNSGAEFLCRILNISDALIEAEIIEKRKNEAEPICRVTLYQALPKKMELFEMVLQKGTEIGIAEFVPLITERTERREIPKMERLLKIVREAAEQSERGKIPALHTPQEFSEALSSASGSSYLFHSRGGSLFSEKLSEIKNQKQISLFIGPEGGFSDSEIEQSKSHHLSIISLGPRILRTETAGIVGAALVLQSL